MISFNTSIGYDITFSTFGATIGPAILKMITTYVNDTHGLTGNVWFLLFANSLLI